MSKETKIMAVILTLVVGGLIGLFWFFGKAKTQEPLPSGKVVRAESHKQGSGPVEIAEFGDFQCPACAAAHPVLEQIMKDYQGKVTFYFRHFPLPMHANAEAAAMASEAAGAQGKFWEMHKKLYDGQKDWSNLADPTAKFLDYAKAIGLNIETYKSDIAAAKYRSIIETDRKDGETLQVSSTPTIYVNGKKAESYDPKVLRGLIDSALSNSKK